MGVKIDNSNVRKGIPFVFPVRLDAEAFQLAKRV